MALLWVEGFDTFGTTVGATVSPAGVVGRKYPLIEREADMKIAPGRFSGYSLQLIDVSTGNIVWMSPGNLTTIDTVVIGFSVYWAGLPSESIYSSSIFMSLYDGSTRGVYLQFTGVGNVVIGCNTILQTISTPISLGTWHFIELKVKCHASAGTYELRIDGVTVAIATGVNTQAGSNTYHSTFRLSGQETNIVGTPRFDDLYFLDSSGIRNNDFLGIQKVTTLFPDGTGSANAWTAFPVATPAADHYTLVDEVVCDDNVTYVESLVSAQKELWAYQDIADAGNISGLQVNVDCRETDANPFNLITTVKTASESDNSASLVGTSSWITKRRILETDPADSTVWDVAKINSAQFGIKVG